MGALASTQRAPPPAFHPFQQWRLSDVQTLLSRFEKEPASFGFQVPEEAFAALIKDLPAAANASAADTARVNGGGSGAAVPAPPAAGAGGALLSPLAAAAATAATASSAPLTTPPAGHSARGHGRGMSISLQAGSIALPPIPAAAVAAANASSASAATAAAASAAASVVPPLLLPISSSSSSGGGVKRAKHSPSHGDTWTVAEEKETSRGGGDHSSSGSVVPVRSAQHHAAREHHAHVHVQPHAPPGPHPQHPVSHPPRRPTLEPLSVSFHAPPIAATQSQNGGSGVSSGSSTKKPALPPPSTSASLFLQWMGPERANEGADELDLLQLVTGLVILCRARYRAKLEFLHAFFDFDEDGILSRRELQALVRAVAVVMHRIFAIPAPSLTNQMRPGTSPAGVASNGSSGGSGSMGGSVVSIREPTVRQCERWNEQLVRRFETSLRAGTWNLDGWLEWGESSPLAVHLLCLAPRTPSGSLGCTDGSRVVARLHDAHRMLLGGPTTLLGAGNSGGGAGGADGSLSARTASARCNSAGTDGSATDVLLRLNGGALTDRSANLYMASPRSARGSSTPRDSSHGPTSPPRLARMPSRARHAETGAAPHSHSYPHPPPGASLPLTGASAAFPPGTGTGTGTGSVGLGGFPLAKSSSVASLSHASSSGATGSSSSGSGSGATSSSTSSSSRFKFLGEKNTQREVMHLKKLFDDMDIDSSGYLSLEYLRRPKKYTEPFLLRDVTAVFQEWRGFGNAQGQAAQGGGQGQARGSGGQSDSSSHRAEVSFSELLDVLYTDLTPSQHALLHSWVPAPVNKEKVRSIQRVFDRLDTEFTGRVKFAKVMAYAFRNENGGGVGAGTGAGAGSTATSPGSGPSSIPPAGLGGSAASIAELQALMEPFVRLRPHRLEIAVTIRELLTALFNRTHSKQLRKILSWSKPSKLLTLEQQAELQRLFQQYDTANEGRFPASQLRQHLVARGLPEGEVDKMMEDIVVEYTVPAASVAAPPTQAHANAAESDGVTPPSPAGVAAQPQVQAQPQAMITLQEFQLFYRSFWDSYVNFQLEEEACRRKKVVPSARLVGAESNPPTL